MKAEATKTRARSPKARKLLEGLAAELDPDFFKALADPARVDLLKLLIVEGPLDIESLAQRFPQDRSVISRHLAALRDVDILTFTKDGRRVVYSANALSVAEKLERILSHLRALHALCCPR